MNEKIKILKTDNFKKIYISFIFPCKREKKFSVYGPLLKRLLLLKTNKYNSEEKFINACISNYVIDFFVSHSKVGDNVYFEYGVVLPDKEILKDEDYSYKKTINFVLDSIYNTYSKEEEFYENEVEKAKKSLKIGVLRDLDNINVYSNYRLREIFDDEGYFNDSIYRNKDDIDKVSSKDLFKCYQEVIKTKRPHVFICGNVSSDFVDLINEWFSDDLTMNDFDTDNLRPYKIRKDVKHVEEKKKYSESIVKYAYKVKDYKKEDSVILPLVSSLLNSKSSHILFNYLRTKEKLVYTASANVHTLHGALMISASISSDKKEKTFETIEQVMKVMKDERKIKKYLPNIKDRIRINMEREKDSMGSLMDDFLNKEFFDDLTSSEEYEIIKGINEKDITSFMDRVYLDTVYYLEGVRDEK